MSLYSRIAAAAVVATAVLMGSVSMTTAEPGQKGKKSTKVAAPSKAQIEAGKKVYTANGCAACHKVKGQGGTTSSDLTKIGKTWKPDKLALVVRDPKKLKKDSAMPAYGPDKINEKELKALVAYLSSLK